MRQGRLRIELREVVCSTDLRFYWQGSEKIFFPFWVSARTSDQGCPRPARQVLPSELGPTPTAGPSRPLGPGLGPGPWDQGGGCALRRWWRAAGARP